MKRTVRRTQRNSDAILWLFPCTSVLEFEDVVVPLFNLSMFLNPFHTTVANIPHSMLPGPTPVQPVPPEYYFLHFDLCAKFNIQFNDVPRITKEELTRMLFYHTVWELGYRGLGQLGVVSTAQFKAQIGLLAEDEEAVVFDREFDPGPLSEKIIYDIQVDHALDTFWGFAI
ncbi:hypothetical protein HETIRDRAFT_115317 [Heterobasidion irregulare TC 32-1]|uniref:Uncharacterized protein n=1 Tax=Heterobasidion irregulare (strain TC 32-1) TaxID=747525 RepID=W4KHP1_HETIT|nr:uncharacterized protein HETIRDRAFT_115317 [Heterobasidion irregulare TC 32-1]ETW85368.1 hypothetical protein HETIRDRAFT_115317 [Heterobasidion irregulare TC 32-1]